eukprot:4998620-Pyramimonas_sp.AAC.1
MSLGLREHRVVDARGLNSERGGCCEANAVQLLTVSSSMLNHFDTAHAFLDLVNALHKLPSFSPAPLGPPSPAFNAEVGS